jgi:hypothetical protein
MSAVISDDFYKRIIHLVTPLQANPWQDWPRGVVVTRQESVTDWAEAGKVTAAEIKYEVMEQGKSIHRIQIIRGQAKRQEFMVADEKGLSMAEENTASIQAALNIDNVMVISRLSKINAVKTDYEKIINHQLEQWSLAINQSILLRQKTECEQWSILSLFANLAVDGANIPCVEIELKQQISASDYIVTRKKLNAQIPGHLAEEACFRVKIDKITGQAAKYVSSHQVVTHIEHKNKS